MGILELLFGGGQGGQPPQPVPRAPQPYLPGRTRMPFEVPQGSSDPTSAFLEEWMRRQQQPPQQNGAQAQPMNYRPDNNAPVTLQMPPGPPGWYQGPNPEGNLKEWLKSQPQNQPQIPPEFLQGQPTPDNIVPGSPGRPWPPQMGDPGYLENRRRMQPPSETFDGMPVPSPMPPGQRPMPNFGGDNPMGEAIRKLLQQQLQNPRRNDDQLRDPGWVAPPGWFTNEPEQMVEDNVQRPQPLWRTG